MIEGGGSKTLSKAKEWIFKYPKESHELLGRITDVCVDFLIGQVHAGAQVRLALCCCANAIDNYWSIVRGVHPNY